MSDSLTRDSSNSSTCDVGLVFEMTIRSVGHLKEYQFVTLLRWLSGRGFGGARGDHEWSIRVRRTRRMETKTVTILEHGAQQAKRRRSKPCISGFELEIGL